MKDFAEYLDSLCGQTLMLSFAGTTAGSGLVAVWAAVGRTHWFLRALAVWGSVMLLVPIRVYEAAAIFAIACPLIVAIIATAQWLSNRRRPPGAGYLVPGGPAILPLRTMDLWSVGLATALAIAACEASLQGRWWFDIAAFLAWVAIVVAIGATAYDFIVTRGRTFRERVIAGSRFTTALFRRATTSLRNSSTSSPNAKLRFGLRDLFFLTLLAALVVAGVRAIQRDYTWHEWWAFGVWGALIAAIVSLAYGCVVSRWRLILALLLAVAVACTARWTPGICGPFFANRFIECLGLGRASAWSKAEKLLAMEIVYAELALLVCVFSALAWLSQPSVGQGLVRRFAGGGLATLALTGGLGLSWLYWQMFWLTPIPPPFAGGTTYYDEILEIVSHVDRRAFWGTPIPPVANVRRPTPPIAGDKQQLIAKLSDAVRHNNYVPFTIEESVFREEDIDEYKHPYEHFYSFAMFLDGEAAALGDQGEFDRAAELAVLNIRLGTMLRRGGTQWSFGSAGQYCESYGYQRLTLIRGNLSPATIMTVLATLRRAAEEPEDTATLRARDQAFEERALGWTMRLRNVFDSLRVHDLSWNPDAEISTFNTLLQTDLALRLYQHECGRLPESLTDLVPGYLPTLPLDPWAKSPQPLKYRVEEGGFVLYSVNANGIDDGGVFGNCQHGIYSSAYDVDVETWTRP